MIRDELAGVVYRATKKAQRKGSLPKTEIPEVIVERPRREAHGDYATSQPLRMIADVNRALQEAEQPKMSPLEVGQRIVYRMERPAFVGAVEVVPPGFINFTLDDGWLAQQVEEIVAAGEEFGDVDLGHGEQVQVEFGSINPNGPLHVGAGRNLALGDTLANVLEATGHSVQREYYLNDAGLQMHRLGQSLYVRYFELLGREPPLESGLRAGEIPGGGYHGQYVVDWAAQILDAEGERFVGMPYQEAVDAIRELGLQIALEHIRQDCERMGIHYDRWFSERTLYDSATDPELGMSTFDHIMSVLRQGNHLYMADGAVWFDAKSLGGDKDEVIIRSNGEPGYFASDIAYHYNKFVRRGFDRVIDVWGADHQGHVPRMKAMMEALGLDPERLILFIYQLVTVIDKGEQVRLSTRAGTLVDLREVLDDIGPDAVRFFLIARAADSQMDLDLDLARRESDENPVYYVQYGHARISSVLRYAKEQGHSDEGADVSLLSHPSELALIRKMLELPEVVAQAAENLVVHPLTHYAQDLAAAFHVFYRDCRVVSSDPVDAELTKARLRLANAAKLVLARTLMLMGVAAPERM
jgi:arginyl-tRNA synthetase